MMEVSAIRQVWASHDRQQMAFVTISEPIYPGCEYYEAYEIIYEILVRHLKSATGKIVVNKSVCIKKSLAA